jgi:dolichyl-diphosphooligosaccharide--protein glycosyltransferase
LGIKETLSKERITSSLKNLGKLRLNISHSRIISIAVVLIILFISFTIRILPLRWEIPSGTVRLNEFDPYYQFILTRQMVNNGILSPYYPTPWVFPQLWAPKGLDMSYSLPALPASAAIIYDIISFLGINIDLMTFCSFFPAIAGTLTVLVTYFIGKDLGGKPVGMIAALFLALSPSFIQRTALGFFDTEVPGMIGLVLFAFLFLRSIDETRSLRSSLTYTFGAGLALAYFIMGWGAAYYVLGLSALFVFILIVLKRYNPRLLISYSVIFGVALFIATKVPIVGLDYLTSAPTIPILGVFLLLCLSEVLRNNISLRTKTILTIGTVAVVVGGFVALWQLGYMEAIAGKFSTVLDPFIRSSAPLIESVAEHRVSAWGNIYYELGIGVIFFLAGLYFTMRNPTNKNIFLLLFGVTSLYFAASMVRLLTVFAPAFSLLVAAGVSGILKPFYTLLREAPQVVTKTKRGIARVSKEYSGIAIFLVFTLLVTQLAFAPQNSGIPRVYAQAYNPLTVTAASLPISPNAPVPEWTNLLSYTQSNLRSTDVVVAWWDYGYWLGILGNVTTLCDNATVNATQIENVGFIMMANETNALKMLQQYNAKYILVFHTLALSQSGQTYVVGPGRWGDEGKWTWMAKISGEASNRFITKGYVDVQSAWTDEKPFGNYSLGTNWIDANHNGQVDSGELSAAPLGVNSTIYKLMSWAKQRWVDTSGTPNGIVIDEAGVQPDYFKEAYFSGLDTSPFAYGGIIPLVALYEIDWQKYYNAIGTTG